jgi:hypothetical protein
MVAAGVQVGHSGGLLVYRQGAASAYTGPVTGPNGDVSGTNADVMTKPVDNDPNEGDRR